MANLRKIYLMNPMSPPRFQLNMASFFDLSAFPHRDLFDPELPPWEMLKLMQLVFDRQQQWVIRCPIPSGVTLINPEQIDLHESCHIESGSYISGPCILGAHTQVRQGAYIRGHLLAGKECVIGHTSEVKNSILLNGAKASHFAYIGNSVIGNEVNLGAGVKCANLRLDSQPISLHWQGRHYPTGLKKLGALIGDGSQIGCNSVLNPGTLLGPQTHVWPLVNVSGIHAPWAQIKTTPRPSKSKEEA